MKTRIVLLVLGVLACVGGCRTVPPGVITQISTIDALMAGAYDGQMPCAELPRYGNLGIGTFDALDGEMVILDGRVHQACSDGTVHCPPLRRNTPFASVVRFVPERRIAVPPGTDFASFQALLDQQLPNQNVFWAIRVRGYFARVKTRAVPGQAKPYLSLLEASKQQRVIETENTPGTVVGFRVPPYAKGIGLTGYHLHFLSDDGHSGGHMLEMVISDGVAEVEACHEFHLMLPKDEGFAHADLTKDRSKDLDKAER